MSMRATFTTSFIYDADTGHKERANEMAKVLGISWEEKNMIGVMSGITSGLDIAELDIRRWINEMCFELKDITIVPFKVAWLLEGGDVIIKEIKPLKAI